MLAIVIVLTVLGGVLPIYAGVRAAITTQRHFSKLDADLKKIKAIAETPGADDDSEGNLARRRAVRSPSVPAYYWIEYAPDIAELRLYQELKKPAILVGLGVVFATAGSLLSLCLP